MKNKVISTSLFLSFLVSFFATNAQDILDKKTHINKVKYINSFSLSSSKKNIFISYVNTTDSTIKNVKRKLHFSSVFSYIKEQEKSFFLKYSTAPVMTMDICNELQKIKLDTIVTYGSPYVMQSTIILFINADGNIHNYGFSWGNPDEYYKKQVLSLLDSLSSKIIFKPAEINGKPVGSIYRIFFNFYSKECKLNWIPSAENNTLKN